MSSNRITITTFAPLLILVGALGFIIPAERSLTSSEPAYNIFHMSFGVIGLLVLMTKNEIAAALFNLIFGFLDLYQFAASKADLFPEWYFQWRTTDDILHIVLGSFLVLMGIYGLLTNRPVPVVKKRERRPLLH